MNLHFVPRAATLLSAAALLVTLGHARPADACACCAENGTRVESTEPIAGYAKAEIERVQFAKVAQLYTNAGEPEVYAKGIKDPASTYALAVTKKADDWTFAWRDASGKTGTLVFTLPKTVESFFIDPRDGKPSSGGGPVLYKEWRLRSPVTGTGIFDPGMKGGATARLILQGRGNSCTEAEQFTHWSLVVSGPNASFTLYGDLTAPVKRP